MHRKPADPRKVAEEAVWMVKQRLKHLRTRVPPAMWTAKEAQEVARYIVALRPVTEDSEKELLRRIRELQRKTPEELRRLVEEAGDDGAK